MACSISILSVLGSGSSGQTTDITVEGTVSGCNGNVRVVMMCGLDPGDPSLPHVTKIVKEVTPINNAWTAVFSRAEIGASQVTCGKCGDDITIFAVCTADPSCTATHSGPLVCVPACPTVNNLSVQVGDCESDGSRKVTVSGTVNNPGSGLIVANLFLHESGQSSPRRIGNAINFNGSSYPINETIYLKGDSSKSYVVELEVSYPTGCQSAKTGSFSVPDCPKCPVISETKAVAGKCDENGKVEVALSAKIEAKQEDVEYYWDDGHNKTGIGTVNKGTTQTVTEKLTYARGDTRKRKVSFVIHRPKGCGNSAPAPLEIQLPDCSCPKVAIAAQVNTEADCDNEGRRQVSITVSGSGTGTQKTKLDLVDADTGKVLQSLPEFQAGRFTHTLTLALTGGKTFTIKPSIVSPKGCGSTSVKIAVPPCKPGDALCPDVEDIVIQEGECDTAGKRTLTVSVKIKPKGPGSVAAVLKDVSDPAKPKELAKASGQSTDFELKATPSYSGGSKVAFELEVSKPANCGTSKTKAHTVTECKKPEVPKPPITDQPKEYEPFKNFWSCGFLRTIAAFFFAGALVCLALIFCPMSAPLIKLWVWLVIIFAALGAIFTILYWVFCCSFGSCECAWPLILFGQAFIGAGVLQLWLTNCCTVVFWILGLAYILIGVLLFIAWAAHCKLTACHVFEQITLIVALVGLVMTPIAVAHGYNVPIPCLNPGIGAGINLALALISGAITIGCVVTANNAKSQPKQPTP